MLYTKTASRQTLSICLSICLSVCLSVSLSVCLSVHESIYLSTYLWMYRAIDININAKIQLCIDIVPEFKNFLDVSEVMHQGAFQHGGRNHARFTALAIQLILSKTLCFRQSSLLFSANPSYLRTRNPEAQPALDNHQPLLKTFFCLPTLGSIYLFSRLASLTTTTLHYQSI